MNTTAFRLANKAAVITGGASGIRLAIAKRFAAHGAAVSAKSDTGQETDMFDRAQQNPTIGCMGQPDEVATAALFLCSDEGSFITGSAYPVDGGTLTLR